MARAEFDAQVQRAVSQFNGGDNSIGDSFIHIRNSVDRHWQTKLVSIILARNTNSAVLAESPQATDNQMCFRIEMEYPVVLTAFEILKAILSQPVQYIHFAPSLLMPQRLDRVEAGRAGGGVDAEDDADQH